ncbi:hypothetical protein O181_057607 [Austropuccinia psidii MF-1]|uniref:Uncharacterized protein n=1 Tax=Austropuccinia psidii MF-1 TaxID=1389203 RepID=A0A9Q3EI44_9BASI|nr:hypothetical protein [Austropuccinia psidii MF-1]
MKESWARNMASQSKSSISRIGAVPDLENSKTLLDSGATHYIARDLSLFSNKCHTNIKLSVTSSEQFNVDIIESIKLKTKFSSLIVSDVLYCTDIPGIVLLIGKRLAQDLKVQFLEGIFILTDGKKKLLVIRETFDSS